MTEEAALARGGLRIGWVDITRGIGVLLVLWGHIFRYGGRPSIVIFSFHMPLFFMISGYLFSPEKTSDFASFARKRAKGLLLPYFAACLLGLLVTLAIPAWRAEISLQTIITDVFYLGAPNCLHVGQVWFFLCLFFVELAAFALYKVVLRDASSAKSVLVVLLIAGAGVTLPTVLSSYFVLGRLPWMLDTGIVALSFYFIGFYTKTSGLLQSVDRTASRRTKVVLSVLALGLTSFLSIRWLGWVNIGALIFSFPPLYFLCAVLGSLGVALLAMAIKECPALQAMGQESLILVVIHSLLIYAFLAMTSQCYGYEIILGENPPKAVALIGSVVLAVVLGALGYTLAWARRKLANRGTATSSSVEVGGDACGSTGRDATSPQAPEGYGDGNKGGVPVAASTPGRSRRNSTIELLRILCMLLVIAHHGVVHGGALGMDPCANKVLASLILPGGKIAFTCFVAISTWFLVDQQFKGSRFLRAWLEVLFYSVAVIAISALLGAQVTARDWIGAFLPIGGNTHGFAAAYLAFYLLLPVLSRISSGLSQAQVRWIVLVGAYLQVIEKVLATYGMADLALHPFPSEILLFVLCYFVSLYIKKWGPKASCSAGAMFATAMTVWLAVFMLTWASWSQGSSLITTFLTAFASDESSLLYLLGGYSLFLAFRALPAFSSRAVDIVAGTTFGILLIHDHGFFRYVLWGGIVNAPSWWYSQHYLLRLVAVTVAVFAVCSLIDYARQRLLERPIAASRAFRTAGEKLDGVWTSALSSHGSS